MQPHLSHDKNLQLAGNYSRRYLLKSCRYIKADISRLHPQVPMVMRKELSASPLVGDLVLMRTEELVFQAAERLQGDVSLRSNTIMDTLAKSQGPRTRAPPLLSDRLRPNPLWLLVRSLNKILSPRAEVGVIRVQAISPERKGRGAKGAGRLWRSDTGLHEGTRGAPITAMSFRPITRENSLRAIKLLRGLVRDRRGPPLGHAHRAVGVHPLWRCPTDEPGTGDQ